MARLRKTAVEIVNLFCIVFLDISEKRVASVFSGMLKVPCPAIRNLCERLSMTADAVTAPLTAYGKRSAHLLGSQGKGYTS